MPGNSHEMIIWWSDEDAALLRGYRDSETVEAYDAFLVKVLHQANNTRRPPGGGI